MADHAQSHPSTLLIVDDDSAGRDVLRRRFERKGFHAQEVPSGRQALELLEKSTYDLILLDVEMPEMDGFAVLTAIRQKIPATALPVIMITAKDQSQDIVRALQLGANDYVVKPLDFSVLLARVHTQLSLNRNAHLAGMFRTQFHDCVQHFFPGSALEAIQPMDSFRWRERPPNANYRLGDLPGTADVGVEWLRARYRFVPPRGTLTPAENRLFESLLRVLDTRYRAMFDLDMPNRLELVHYPVEDWVAAECAWPQNIVPILEGLRLLRVAALLTYENRRLSTGILFTKSNGNTALTPETPQWPRVGGWLFQTKSLQRLCDGLHTVFAADGEGYLRGVAVIEAWARRNFPDQSLPGPCPRAYKNHAQITANGDSLCMVLTPSQEIKIFVQGRLKFDFRGARWQMPDIPAKFAEWQQAVNSFACPRLSEQIFQAALDLAESRHGALFVLLERPEESLPRLVARDHPAESRASESCSRLLEKILSMTVADEQATHLDSRLLESLATIDGAIVLDGAGKVLAAGAILRIALDSASPDQRFEGARTTAACVASRYGPVLKVSEDGIITFFHKGQSLWSF